MSVKIIKKFILDITGHIRLQRVTLTEREEMKKKEKEQSRRRDEEQELYRAMGHWVKYTRGLHHQVGHCQGYAFQCRLIKLGTTVDIGVHCDIHTLPIC